MTPLERIAHDIICICKYGSPGGSASATELKRVVDYLDRVRPLPEQPRVTVAPPRVAIRPQAPVVAPPVLVMHKPDAPTVRVALPTIRLP